MKGYKIKIVMNFKKRRYIKYNNQTNQYPGNKFCKLNIIKNRPDYTNNGHQQ